MELSSNPLPLLTLPIASAIFTSASCVALIGTGNRFGRTIERCQESIGAFDVAMDADSAALQLRMRQVKTSEARASLIIGALYCFYAAIAGSGSGFVMSLLSASLFCARLDLTASVFTAIALVTEAIGATAIIAGATMLFRESRFTFRTLEEKSRFFAQQAGQVVLRNSELSPDR